jgi:hypothetical protein
MKNFVRLNKNEMKMVMGGVEPEGIDPEGKCTSCDCADGSTSCWYSLRSVSELCRAVCGSSVGYNGLAGVSCNGCTMN